jgi:hypothetical protein
VPALVWLPPPSPPPPSGLLGPPPPSTNWATLGCGGVCVGRAAVVLLRRLLPTKPRLLLDLGWITRAGAPPTLNVRAWHVLNPGTCSIPARAQSRHVLNPGTCFGSVSLLAARILKDEMSMSWCTVHRRGEGWGGLETNSSSLTQGAANSSSRGKFVFSDTRCGTLPTSALELQPLAQVAEGSTSNSRAYF